MRFLLKYLGFSGGVPRLNFSFYYVDWLEFTVKFDWGSNRLNIAYAVMWKAVNRVRGRGRVTLTLNFKLFSISQQLIKTWSYKKKFK